MSVWHFASEGLIWLALGGEVVVDYARMIPDRLRKVAPGVEEVWVAGYCHDVMAYIPSRRVLDEGGYEGGGAMVYYGLPGPWAEDVEERVLRQVEQPFVW